MGSTIHTALRSEIVNCFDVEIGVTLPGEFYQNQVLSEYKIHKHSKYRDITSVFDEKLLSEFRFLSSIREPTARFVSAFYHLKRNVNQSWIVNSDDYSLVKAIDKYEDIYQFAESDLWKEYGRIAGLFDKQIDFYSSENGDAIKVNLIRDTDIKNDLEKTLHSLLGVNKELDVKHINENAYENYEKPYLKKIIYEYYLKDYLLYERIQNGTLRDM